MDAIIEAGSMDLGFKAQEAGVVTVIVIDNNVIAMLLDVDLASVMRNKISDGDHSRSAVAPDFIIKEEVKALV